MQKVKNEQEQTDLSVTDRVGKWKSVEALTNALLVLFFFFMIFIDKKEKYRITAVLSFSATME